VSSVFCTSPAEILKSFRNQCSSYGQNFALRSYWLRDTSLTTQSGGPVRYLFLLAVIAFALLLWRRWLRQAHLVKKEPQPERSPEPMVQCRNCGLYVPKADAVADGRFHYCSEAHRDQDSAR
jgi:uncharacterized protein